MDAIRLSTPRRLSLEVSNRFGAGRMTVLDFGDPSRPVDLIFAHANGFNALTYRTLLAPLSGALRIWAPDLRGHGSTTLPTPASGRRGWADHAADLTSLLDHLDGARPVLAGHSMGGTSSLLAAARSPDRVKGLVLFDPVIWGRGATLAFQLPLLDRAATRVPIAVNALKRRDRFDSREQAFKAYQGRGAFKGWPEAMLVDYLADGLVEDGEGLRLSCTPAWEASNYAAQSHDPWRALARYRGPIHILKGQTGSTCSVPEAPRGRPHVTVETVPDTTHFLPMQRPDVARDALLAATEA